jgi:hypothetical protein
MVNDDAFVVVQESVALFPLRIEVGEIESVHEGPLGGGGGGGGSLLTVTVAVQVTDLPASFCAVPVYVVVTLGETVFEPLPAGVTEPIP